MTVRLVIILYQQDTRLLVCKLSPLVFDSFPLLSLTAVNEQVSKYCHFYRPQRSWAKVIFSQACVKNSVHRGGGRVSASVHAGIHPSPREQTHLLPGKQTAAYGQRAAGTHPTGMHSCLTGAFNRKLVCLRMVETHIFKELFEPFITRVSTCKHHISYIHHPCE